MSVNTVQSTTIWLSLDEVRNLLRNGCVTQTDAKGEQSTIYLNFVDRVQAHEVEHWFALVIGEKEL